MAFDLLQRKQSHFLLWRPESTNPPPALIIGTSAQEPAELSAAEEVRSGSFTGVG